MFSKPIQTVPLGEVCPVCYAKTILRTNSKTNAQFVGCENFPECKFSTPYLGKNKTKVSNKIRSIFFSKLTKDAPKNMSDEEKIIYCDALGRFFYERDYDNPITIEFIWDCIFESIKQWPEIKSIVNNDKIYYALKKRVMP